MIDKSDCVYERLEKGEIYTCHLCKERIFEDFYGIYKGTVAEGGTQIGVQKYKEAFPTPTTRKKFYMVIFHTICFNKMAGTDFQFRETPGPENSMAGKRFA